MQQDGFFFLVRHHLIPPFLPQLREVHLVFLFFLAHQNCVMKDGSNSQGENLSLLRLCVSAERNGRPRPGPAGKGRVAEEGETSERQR